jgi:hypothetical protein
VNNTFDRSDISQDDFRRELRDVDAVQRGVMPRWSELLHRVFSGDERLTTPEKAQLLGVPGRRQFLKIGGATIAGAALLAACGDDDTSGSGATTTSTTAGTSSTTAGDAMTDDPNMDIVLANTAISLEVLAIAAYETAAGSGLVTTAAVGDAAKLFMGHHKEHRDALIATVKAAGATPYTKPNEVVKKAIVDPAVQAAKTEADIIKLAWTLETAAAQTYVFAAGALSTPELRSTIMTIGGVESRHAQILGAVSKAAMTERFPNAFFKSDNPLPDGAVITG